MKSERKALTEEFIKSSSEAICDRVLSLDPVKCARCIMLYMSSFKEPDTLVLLKKLWKMGIKTAVPVSDADTFTITPSFISSTDDLIKGAYGISEPRVVVAANIRELDLALIPAVAFDKYGNRLGFGKGYYDRFLAEFLGTKIGIGYDFQVADFIPNDPYDIKMDLIVTEKRIYNDF